MKAHLIPDTRIGVLFFLLLIGFASNGQQEDLIGIIDSLRTRQNYLLGAREIDSALVINSRLIKYHRSQGDNYEMVRQHVNRAEMLRIIGGYREALNTLNEVEELNKELPYSTVRSSYHNRKAAILHQYKKPYLALAEVSESQRIDSIKGFRWRTFSNINLKGALYRDLHQYEKAREVLKAGYDLARDARDSAEWASAAFNLTLLSSRLKDFHRVIYYGRSHLLITPDPENRRNYGDILHQISEAYAALKRWDSAFFYSDSAFGFRMRAMQEIIDDNVNKYELVNDLEQERLENSVLQTEKERTSLQLLILVLAVIVAMLLIYFSNRQRIIYKRSSKQEKAFNEELRRSLEFKNKLISIVAHDIRNPIASLKGLIHIYNEGLVEEKDLNEMMGGLEATVANVDLLLENLLNWVRSQGHLLKPHLEETRVALLFDNAILEAQAQTKAKRIKIEVNQVDKSDLVLNTDRNFVAFALRNIVSNAIKFSAEDSRIELSCHADAKHAWITVKDFGRGMNAETLKNLNESKTVRPSAGTDKERGTGLGIGLSKEFIAKLDGHLKIESEMGEGTTVQLVLPLQ